MYIMKVNYVFVICCAVPLLLHTVDSHEYCKIVEQGLLKYAHCTPRDTNYTLDHVPIITDRIMTINLNGQPLKQLPRNALANITSQTDLIWAMFENCQIEHIDVDAFMNLDSLKHLILSGNHISHLEIGTFQHTRSLETLSMLSNNLEKLQAGLFHNMAHLEEVYFKNNSISTIDEDTFRNTPVLYWIDVEHNKLESLSPLITDRFKNITRLYVRNNPWNCDCNMKEFFVQFKLKKRSNAATVPVCKNPPAFRGKKFPELHKSDFKCRTQGVTAK